MLETLPPSLTHVLDWANDDLITFQHQLDFLSKIALFDKSLGMRTPASCQS